MTVYVHVENRAINIGTHSHVAPQTAAGERTWTFDCTPECETRVLRDVEHCARAADGVPQTEAEKRSAQQMEESAKRDVSRLAMALGQLAESQSIGA